MRQKLARGFTLIELLVGIAIIAILAAILFPVFAGIRERAKSASCQSNLKQLSMAVLQYSQSYDGFLVTGGGECYGSGPGCSKGSPRPGLQWQWLIQPYVKTWAVYKCPSDTRPITNQPVSYVINNWATTQRQSGFAINDTQLGAPANTVMLMDSTEASWAGNTVETDAVRMMGDYTLWNYWDRITKVDPGWGWGDNSPRHGDGDNVSWVDGHVKWVHLEPCRNSLPGRGLGNNLPWTQVGNVPGSPDTGGAWDVNAPANNCR